MTVERFDTKECPPEAYIENCPNELEVDIIFMKHLINAGSDFYDLAGSSLRDFIKKCIISIMKRGGVPLVPAGNQQPWIEQKQYGTETEEIAENMVSQWEKGELIADWDGPMFGYPGYH